MLALLIVAFAVGHATPVTCVPDLHGYGGYTTPNGQVQLTQEVCDTLTRPGSWRFPFALLTTVHEAMHVRGLVDERATDCAALTALPGVLRRFYPRVPLWHRQYTVKAARTLHANSPPPYAGAC